MIVAWVLKMESPWSTPTQSEIGEAEAALHNPKGGFFLDPPGDRELGDGEPSFDANVDDYMAMAANNNIEGQDFADDLSQRSSSRGATTRGSKPKRSNSKSPEKRASRSPTKKGGRKGKKSNSKLDPGQGKKYSIFVKVKQNYSVEFTFSLCSNLFNIWIFEPKIVKNCFFL